MLHQIQSRYILQVILKQNEAPLSFDGSVVLPKEKCVYFIYISLFIIFGAWLLTGRDVWEVGTKVWRRVALGTGKGGRAIGA